MHNVVVRRTHETIGSLGLCPEAENEASWRGPGFSAKCVELLGATTGPSCLRAPLMLSELLIPLLADSREHCGSSSATRIAAESTRMGLSVNETKIFSSPPVEILPAKMVPLRLVSFSP